MSPSKSFYACMVKNKKQLCVFGENMHENGIINLVVISLVSSVPASIYQVSNDITVNEGSNVTLSCLANGRPDPAITWRLLNPSGKNCQSVLIITFE